MLGVQMHLTALNAKAEPEAVLVAEFDRVFSREDPEAIQWAFRVWREESAFFPPVSEIRRLVNAYKRGQREQRELKERLEDRFLLEERRKQGQEPAPGELFEQLRSVVETAKPEHMERQKQFAERMEMKRISLAAATLTLTEEGIQARRDKERAEIQRYRDAATEGERD